MALCLTGFLPWRSTIHTIDFKRLPRLFYFSLGALCSLLITAIVLEQRTAVLIEQQTQAYGAALARMAAQQAVDAALNHDLVSLQVTLQDVVDNSGVVFATIHDVENNLLVQAGNALAVRTGAMPVIAQTAPITLHDSVAGYVTVSVAASDTGAGIVVTAVGAIAVLLLMVGALSVYDNRDRLFTRAAPAHHDNAQGVGRTPAGAPTPDDEPTAGHPLADASIPSSATASVRLTNLPQLRRQLSADAYQALAARLEQRLEDVLSLYNGQLEAAAADGADHDYLLRFDCGPEENLAECSFRAVCAVHLLSRLLAESKPAPLRMGATISLEQPAPAPDAPLLLLSEPAVELLLPQQKLLIRDAPSGDASEQHYQLQGFVEPLRRLLERQYDHLRQLRD